MTIGTLRFYTLPPISESYPFIILNANRPEIGLRYLRSHRPKSVIIDSGVEIFRDPSVREYPFYHLSGLARLYHSIKRLAKETWVTIPDYPDDYTPTALWISNEITNIERTHENILEALSKHSDVNWLIPIQGHNEKPQSIIKAVKLLERDGILSTHDFYAVANLCTSKKPTTIESTLHLARWLLPRKRLHSFGISLTAALHLNGVIDSFDSMAWTFPRGRGRASCRNQQERVQYFHEYITKLPPLEVSL